MTTTGAHWLSRTLAETWMSEPMHPRGIGYSKIDPAMLEIIQDGPVTIEEVYEELQKEAKDRGYDYEFSLSEDYDIDADITWYLIEWRMHHPIEVTEGE